MATPSTLDTAQGLFETLLVFKGEPVELGAHLERLAASLVTLFAAPLPPGLADEARERAGGIELGRMRIDARPHQAGTEATFATEAVDRRDVFPAWQRGAALRGVPCEGGLGPHKWADRSWLNTVGAGSVPLLLDRGGEVLEAARANVFAAFEDTLATPRADGRILPGTARAGAIAAARETGIDVVERPLTREQLLEADEVFLTGSVRGVEPVRSLDGTAMPPPREISRRVGDGLRRRWLGDSLAIAAPAPEAAPPPGPLAR